MSTLKRLISLALGCGLQGEVVEGADRDRRSAAPLDESSNREGEEVFTDDVVDELQPLLGG